MNRWTWILLPVMLWCVPALGQDRPRQASDHTRVLEIGPPDQWAASVRALISDNGKMSAYAVASVVKRLAAMKAPERKRIARGLRGKKNDRRAVGALVGLCDDADPQVRQTAMKALLYGDFPLAIPPLKDMLTPDHPIRKEIISKLAAIYVAGQKASGKHTRSDDFGPVRAGRAARDSDRESVYLPAIAAMMQDQDPKVRRATARAMANFVDGRVNGWLLFMTRDADDGVRMEALWQLAARGDERACDPLYAWAARSRGEKDSSRWRDRRFASVGGYCADQRLIDYLEQYRHAATDADKHDFRSLIRGAVGKHLLDKPGLMQDMMAYAHDEDPFISSRAEEVLAWRKARDEALSAEKIKGGIKPLVLVLVAAVSALFGMITFLWAFRLLNLRRYLKTAPTAKTRSLAMGLTTLHGEAQPIDNRHLIHPETGEACLYYAGADRAHPGHRFYLQDDTGRVPVDPAHAIFLSEDDTLLPGEPLHLMGCAMSVGRASNRIIVGKPAVVRTLFDRIVHWLVQGLVGGLARRGRSKIWFSDPSACFWLWDDACEPPFASGSGFLATIATLLLAGAWVLCFAAAVLSMIDQSLGQQLIHAVRALVS